MTIYVSRPRGVCGAIAIHKPGRWSFTYLIPGSIIMFSNITIEPPLYMQLNVVLSQSRGPCGLFMIMYVGGHGIHRILGMKFVE